MKLPVIDITLYDNEYRGYYYDMHKYIRGYGNKNKTVIIDNIRNKIYNNINKYIVVYNNRITVNKICICDKQVEYIKQSNYVYTIIYENIKYHIYKDHNNIYKCIKYEAICPDIDERIEYLKNNNMSNNLINLIK